MFSPVQVGLRWLSQFQKVQFTVMPVGIGMGVAIGTGLGAALKNMALGIGVGIAIGAGLGVALMGAANANSASEQRKLRKR